jgi:outer membrane protein OmpA-like peptidoglycan-associated protein
MLVLVLALSALLTPTAVAQDFPKHELFAGYSYYNANGWYPTRKAPEFKGGWAGSYTYNFSKWLGLEGEISGHYNNASDKVHMFMAGPRAKFRTGDHFSPFIHTLVGFAHNTPFDAPAAESFSSALGGGFDVDVNRRWSIRMFEADYVYTRYEAVKTPNRWEGFRLQGGIIYNMGIEPEEKPVSAACVAAPTEVMAGEPIKVTVTPNGFLPKRTLTYAWTTNGGKVSGTGTEASVDTTGLAPGSYVVGAKVTDNGKGKHQQTTSCNANFTIKEPPKHPPVMTSCAASAASVMSGDPVTFSTDANSPDGRPLTYTFDATSGRISGTGQKATLDTAGLPAGPVTVNCKVSDDRGLTDGKSASVNVEVPPPPPQSSKINSINFPDTKKPARVDNAAKAVLDEVALRLQREADAKAVVVGFGTDTKKVKNLAAQRAVNTKDYLVKEKGIDPSRIEVRTGEGATDTADIWIVPTGATFNAAGTTVVDETKITPPVVKKPVAKKAKKVAAQ